MTAPLWLFIWIMFMAFAVRRLILYLHVFQQEEYDAPRFLKWVVTTGSFDKRLSLWVASLLVIMMFFAHLQGWVAGAIVGGLFISAAWRERNPLKDAKKKLVLTARAKRIMAIAIIYAGALGLVFAFLYLQPIYWLIPIQAAVCIRRFSVSIFCASRFFPVLLEKRRYSPTACSSRTSRKVGC